MANNQTLAQQFKALGDENRVKIMRIIAANNEIAAHTLLAKLSISQPTLSHHMKVLAEAEFIEQRKVSREIFYSINSNKIKDVIAFLDLLS